MEGLDLLKKDWDKERNFPKVTENEVYKMIHKKSSSIVKWIFIISVLEISLWIGLSFLFSDDNQKETLVTYHLDTFILLYTYIHWAIVAFFIYLFYKNFKNISATSSARTLMKSIINVRKIVKYYVGYNIIGTILVLIFMWISMFQYDPTITSIIENADEKNTEIGVWVGMIFSLLIMGVIVAVVLWCFYSIIYGILLKRLNKNYNELKKMEL
jgi:hypothetical protein